MTISWEEIPNSTYESYESTWEELEIGDELDFMALRTALYSMPKPEAYQEIVIALESIDKDNKLVTLDSGKQLRLNRSKDGNSYFIDDDGNENYIITAMFKRWKPASSKGISLDIEVCTDSTLDTPDWPV